MDSIEQFHVYVSAGPADDLRTVGDVTIDVDPEVRPHAIFGTTRKSAESMEHEALDRAFFALVGTVAQMAPDTFYVAVITGRGPDRAWRVTEQGFIALTVGYGSPVLAVR